MISSWVCLSISLPISLIIYHIFIHLPLDRHLGCLNILAPILWPPEAKKWLIQKDPDAGKDLMQEEKGTTEDEVVELHHWLNGHEFEQILGDGERQGCLTCCSLWVHKKSDMTEWLSNKIFWLFMKNAAMNQWIWEYRYLYNVLFSFPLDIYPVVGLPDHLLDHMVVLFLNFKLLNYLNFKLFLNFEEILYCFP